MGAKEGLSAAANQLTSAELKAVLGVLKQIAKGTTKGEIFKNLATQQSGFVLPLPEQPMGYDTRYVVNLGNGKGVARIVVGIKGEIYASLDHYTSWIKLK